VLPAHSRKEQPRQALVRTSSVVETRYPPPPTLCSLS
jgi:hypothetical protein